MDLEFLSLSSGSCLGLLRGAPAATAVSPAATRVRTRPRVFESWAPTVTARELDSTNTPARPRQWTFLDPGVPGIHRLSLVDCENPLDGTGHSHHRGSEPMVYVVCSRRPGETR